MSDILSAVAAMTPFVRWLAANYDPVHERYVTEMLSRYVAEMRKTERGFEDADKDVDERLQE